MAKNYERLCGLTRKAIMQYKMIEDGDKVCIGVSGGKDSVILTLALAKLRKYMNINFDIVALTLDPKFFNKEMDYSVLEQLFKDNDIEYVIKRTDIGPIIFDERKESNPCSLCARMRRGALHDAAIELGCNKIALGHHLDDAIETFYMNLWNEGRIGTFSPVTYLSKKDITMIRPLAIAHESDVIKAVKEINAPIVKSTCPVDGTTQRQITKEFVNERCIKDPAFRQKTLNAFQKKDLDGWGINKA